MKIQEWVYLDIYYKAEEEIARRLYELQNAKNNKKFQNVEKQLKEISKIKLSDKQKEAIELVNENNVTVITGGPGTGKTTIIKEIIELYNSISKKVVLCAPTGRAAKRMTEATGQEAMTLHRLLEIGKIGDEKPRLEISVAPLDADVLIIDEMSMVDLFLMHYVLKALYKGTKLVMVGDANQLPSVGPGSVLKDILDSKKIPSIALNKIFRQAAKSKIIVNSHKVNDGISFVGEIDKNNEDTLDDFEFISETNIKISQEKILQIYDAETQIISPTKQGNLGTIALNKLIQENFNPKSSKKKEKKYGEVIFREGDKVMQTKNNYDIEWIKYETKPMEYGSGVFNGEMGIVNEIDNEEGTVSIEFEDGKVALYSYADLDQIIHAYAITVHKAQGSEFDKVIMTVLQVPQMLLTRNILYTGMTRAKKYLTIIGTQYIIEYMINNINTKKRNTGLRYKLK